MNKEKTKISAQVVADSLSPQGDRLTSLLITFPRIILSELLTHRMLSKNTSSSRAIPFNKMVESIKNDPFVPIAWQKQHSGMQGTEYWDVSIIEEIGGFGYTNIPAKWLRARDTAINMAETLHNSPIGITKQLCNRLLEPFMWTTMLITGSKEGWDNFFFLRLPEYHLENVPTVNEDLSLNSKTLTLIGKSKKELLKQINEIDNDSYTGFKTIINNYSDLDWLQRNKGQAEIHIMDLAEKIYDAMNDSKPKQLKAGEWHIPFGDKIHKVDTSVFNNPELVNPIFDLIRVKVSTAMAARTSYTVVGDEKEIDYEKMINLHDRLLTQDPPHSSPMEHCCLCVSEEEYNNSFKGVEKGWFRNYRGFKSYREIIESSR